MIALLGYMDRLSKLLQCRSSRPLDMSASCLEDDNTTKDIGNTDSVREIITLAFLKLVNVSCKPTADVDIGSRFYAVSGLRSGSANLISL
jgi:hypothetical protein